MTYIQRKHNKTYKGFDEHLTRHLIFNKNFETILRHNREADRNIHTYRMAINQFADMTHKEFLQLLNINRNRFNSKSFNSTLYPKFTPKYERQSNVMYKNWQQENNVTNVKTQGNVYKNIEVIFY